MIGFILLSKILLFWELLNCYLQFFVNIKKKNKTREATTTTHPLIFPQQPINSTNQKSQRHPTPPGKPFRFLEQVDVHKLCHAHEFPKMPSILSQNSKHRPKLLIITKHTKILTLLYLYYSLSPPRVSERKKERERESVCVGFLERETRGRKSKTLEFHTEKNQEKT